MDPFLPVSHFTLVHPHSQTSSRQSSSPFLGRAAVPRGSVDFSASRRRLYSNPRSLYTESLVCAKNRHVSIRQLLVAPLPRPVDAQSPPDVHRTPGSASQVQARFGRLVWKRKLWLVFAGLTGQRFEILERFLKKLPPSPSELSRHHHQPPPPARAHPPPLLVHQVTITKSGLPTHYQKPSSFPCGLTSSQA